MKLDRNTKILIVGLGLIGGSYADALSSAGFEVGAITKDPDDITYALDRGIIQSGQTTVDPAYVGQFDLVVFALYPHLLPEWIETYQNCLKRGALLTDVTGVKGPLVYRVQELLREDLEFIGAHPMAGREVSGVRNASKDLFRGANYIITPTAQNTEAAIEACTALGQVLGFARISRLTPEEHDEMIGFLSQLTHCIAVALMVSKESHHLVDYTGDSFRDLTRIAKINDEMWSELFLLNKRELLSQMDLFSEKFRALRDSIAEDDTDGLRQMMRLSTERRRYFDKPD